jgi:hypothetical protein
MISVARKARPRRSPNRVQLVELDGSPVRRPDRDHAATWPAWTDNFHWESIDRVVGTDSMGADVHESDCDDGGRRDGAALWAELMIEASLPPVMTDAEWEARLTSKRPSRRVETDAEFLARLEREEAAEKARVMATYQPLPEDLAELAAWSEALDGFRNQVSSDELAQLAAHGCI